MDEAQLAELQKWANLGQALMNDKRTRSAAEKLAKTLDPNIETSEDAAEPLLNPLREELRDVKAQLKGITDGAAEWAKNEKLAGLRAQGYTPDGIAKIEEIMADKKITDPDVAAAYFDRVNPPAKAKASSPSFGADIFGVQGVSQEKQDLLFSDPEAFMAQEVELINQEFNNQ